MVLSYRCLYTYVCSSLSQQQPGTCHTVLLKHTVSPYSSAFSGSSSSVSPRLLDPSARKAYFSNTAITTVGYGEITPRSFLGRLITLPLLVFGLLLIALPSFVLGREFSIVWNEMTMGPGQVSHEFRLRSSTIHRSIKYCSISSTSPNHLVSSPILPLPS